MTVRGATTPEIPGFGWHGQEGRSAPSEARGRNGVTATARTAAWKSPAPRPHVRCQHEWRSFGVLRQCRRPDCLATEGLDDF